MLSCWGTSSGVFCHCGTWYASPSPILVVHPMRSCLACYLSCGAYGCLWFLQWLQPCKNWLVVWNILYCSYIGYWWGRLDPHQAVPRPFLLLHSFPLLIPFYFPFLTSHHQSSPLLQVASMPTSAGRCWAGLMAFWRKAAALQPYMNHLHMVQLWNSWDMLGYAISALTLEIFVWRFHFLSVPISSSCFGLAVLCMPCKSYSDSHLKRQGISYQCGHLVQIPSDTELHSSPVWSQLDKTNAGICCTILIPWQSQCWLFRSRW